MNYTVKAISDNDDGEWRLEVLGVPFGSDTDRDSDKQYFDADTAVHLDKYPTIPAVYYHGRDPNGRPMSSPEYFGTAKHIRTDERGHWYEVVLDKAKKYARRVWDAAKQGIARASSGAAPHLVRIDQSGRIKEWAVVELSIFDTGGARQPANKHAIALPMIKAIYQEAGIELPNEMQPEATGNGAADNESIKTTEKKKMSELTPEFVTEQIAAALKAQRDADAAKAAQEKADQERIDAEVKRQVDAVKAEAAKNRRLPEYDGAPHVSQFGETRKYDGLTAGETSLVIETLKSNGKAVSTAAYKALAFKVAELTGDNTPEGQKGVSYVKSAFRSATGIEPNADAIKGATDPMLTTGTTDGGNWVGTAYSNELWAAIRAQANIAAKIPSIVIPDGYSSQYFPVEGADPTWYKVAETTSADATMGFPAATVTASQATVLNKQISVAKMGARVMYTGEMTEDSLVQFAPQLRAQLVTSGADMIDHIVIDGDTDAANVTNINHIGGDPGGTEIYLLANGFRKLALVTNTANSRSGGSLDEDDFLETMWLMGTAGLAGADMQKCGFIIDPNVYKQALKMAAVKTKDVWSNATLESGVLTRIWGYEVLPSWNMHRTSTTRKSNSAGKVDQTTPANNVYGSILAVRWDQWKLAYKRRMTIETTRFANSDTWEIVALSRWGLGYRDTEAAAITYGLAV